MHGGDAWCPGCMILSALSQVPPLRHLLDKTTQHPTLCYTLKEPCKMNNDLFCLEDI